MPHLPRAWEARVLLRLRQPQGEAERGAEVCALFIIEVEETVKT